MVRRFVRLATLLPFIGVLLLPGTVTAAPSPGTFNGHGLSVMVPAEAQLINMTATVPFRLRCDPIPNAASFGMSGQAHLRVSQTSRGRTNVAAGDVFIFVNTFGSGGRSGNVKPSLPTGGGPTGFQFPITCDGSTWNPVTFFVTPDFATDPLTGALRTGNVGADLTAQLCTFRYGGGNCDSIDSGRFSIRLIKNRVSPGGGTSFNGQGMQVSFPQPAALQGLQVSVTIQVVCNPVLSTFGFDGNGHLTMQQTRSGRVAAGAAEIFWSPNGAASPLGGEGGPPGQPIRCDGSTVNSYSLLVSPDFFFDPFTEALQPGSATTEFASEICGFSYIGPTCDSIDTGPFGLRITR